MPTTLTYGWKNTDRGFGPFQNCSSFPTFRPTEPLLRIYRAISFFSAPLIILWVAREPRFHRGHLISYILFSRPRLHVANSSTERKVLTSNATTAGKTLARFRFVFGKTPKLYLSALLQKKQDRTMSPTGERKPFSVFPPELGSLSEHESRIVLTYNRYQGFCKRQFFLFDTLWYIECSINPVLLLSAEFWRHIGLQDKQERLHRRERRRR